MSAKRKFLVVAAALVLAGCYHATIETGLAPSNVVIDKPWAMGFVYGLVPPSPVETMQRCPNGVSKVETQLSFLNQLVNGFTLGIVTPMSIRVTCAAARTSAAPARIIDLGGNPSLDAYRAALAQAADITSQTLQPVFVKY